MTKTDPSQEDAMRDVVAGLKTKSAKIRALGNAGYARADIARFLGIRYQHVRNVALAAQEQPAAFIPEDENAPRQWVHIAADGRLVIPAAFRRSLGVENGGDVQLSWDGNALRVRSHKAVIKEIQEFVRAHRKGEGSMVDELIAERRAEAARE
jgi:bifunctional DNA-binding transcriptional regulator/antitoxin component of YhaV-PrlF toxin-antitoxin module